MSSIFREKAMDDLKSPDELDTLMTVTDTRSWVALVALGMVVFLTVIWGFYGTLPVKVSGQGILIKSGGVKNVVTSDGGQVMDLQVEVGSIVERGDIVARLDHPALKTKLENERARLNDLLEERDQIEQFNTEELALNIDDFRQKRGTLRQKLDSLRDQRDWLEQKVDSREQLLEDGLITQQQLVDTRQELRSVELQISEQEGELERIQLNRASLNRRQQKALREIQRQIEETRRSVRSIEQDFQKSTNLHSPYTGRVLEIDAASGGVLSAGETVLMLELVGKSVTDLEAVFYVSATQGKRIKEGMDVQISPSTVKSEESGFLMGKVTRVSDFPVSRSRMNSVLNNERLVEDFSRQQSPIEVYAYLTPESGSTSGYRWSSSDPDVTLSPGTVLTSSVVVEEQAPVDLVIPKIREFLGI